MLLRDHSFSTPQSSDASARRLIGQLTRRYALVLVAVATLVAIDQAIVQPLLLHLNTYAPVINIAGRQRMLSQKLTKGVLALAIASDEEERRLRRTELRDTATKWSAAHAKLSHTQEDAGRAPLDSVTITRELAALQPQFDAMVAAAHAMLEQAEASDAASPNAATTQAVRTILDHEADYLARMEQVVALLEQAARAEVFRLRLAALAIALTVLTLLAVLGWAVVRPATRAIRTQVDELENRVTLRTRELANANQALRREMFEREQAESRHQQLALQLAHAGRVSALGHLTVGLAHELNQPLGAISNYSEACDLLLSSNVGNVTTVQRHLARVKEAAARASQIVRRMRNFVRPQRQSSVLSDLNSLAREVVELCQAEARIANVDVSLDLATEEMMVSIDPIQIQQVLVNLAQNAFQAMQARPRGQRRLQIRTSNNQRSLLVEVVDSGPGISSYELTSLFTPFHTTKSDGLGIGLSICRTIIERHGGEIWADSQPGQGTTICFTLPNCSRNDVSIPERADSLCSR